MLRSTRVYWIRYLESTLPTDRRLLSFGWFSPNRASSERSAKNVRLACCLTATCFQNVRDLVWIREHSSILFTRLGHKDHIFVGPHVAWHSFLRLSDSFDPKGWWLGSWSWWLWKLFEVANCTFACGALGNRLWDLLILGVFVCLLFVCLFACLLACLLACSSLNATFAGQRSWSEEISDCLSIVISDISHPALGKHGLVWRQHRK